MCGVSGLNMFPTTTATQQRVGLMSFRGHCAGCDASFDSERFASRPNGLKIPTKKAKNFAFESDVNNRLCTVCYDENWKLLLSLRKEEEKKIPPRKDHSTAAERGLTVFLTFLTRVNTFGRLTFFF